MSKLALLGGTPTIGEPLRPYRTMSARERQAVIDVVDSDCLSGFYGSWGDQFLGGPKVREFEQAWAKRFGCRHAISVNSATSGLVAAIGAAQVGPGDEVIVPPYTMSATAIAPLAYGGVPVFADIDGDTFCLSVDAVRSAVTPRTRAIIAVNLFGHPARLHELRRLADELDLILIEDNAQGPLASEDGRYAGTIGHIGVFSLNYHKHIHTGEGGVCVTDDDELATRLQLIRNHGENVVEHVDLPNLVNHIGFNFRMTELSAAVGLVQLDCADEHVGRRVRLAEALTNGLAGLEGIATPVVREGCRHVYYVWTMRVDERRLGISRETFSKAVAAEGFPHGVGYVRPLYLLPVFQQRMAIGRNGFPFGQSAPSYAKGLCPVTERLHERELIGFEVCAYDISEAKLAQLVSAVRKVHDQREQLLRFEERAGG
jgi:perosamine synthetase